jgi:hypothetical protein
MHRDDWRSRIGRARGRWAVVALPLLALALMLGGCGATRAGTSAGPASGTLHAPSAADGSSKQVAGGSTAVFSSNTATSKPPSQNVGPGTYLIKSLQVDMAVQDPRVSANDLRQWITTTDPRAQTAGVDYERQDDGTYLVQMTFAVEASAYGQVQSYLAGYAASHQGRLLHLHENVQDVSNQVADLQSRLANLRAEQQRLQALMAQSKSLTDTIAIESRLTDVEGQIEQIEGQQSQLSAQTTYYNVTINLSPVSSLTGTPLKPGPWDPGQVLQSAWAAAAGFGEFLASVAIWLGVFAIYIVPALVIAWLIWRRTHPRKPTPLPNPSVPQA